MTNSSFVSPGDYFKTRFHHLESRKHMRPIICSYFQKYISKDSTVLELAYGYWDFINNISCWKKIAIEINPESKDYLIEWVDAIVSDIAKDNRWEELVRQQIKCDHVFASNFFEHLDDNELVHVVNQIKKCLVPWWTLLLLQPNYYYFYREYFDDFTHKKVFSHHSLKDFLESQGLRVSHIEKKFLPWNFKKNIFPIRLGKILLRLYFLSPYRLWGQMFLVSTYEE